jgi:hypothetical protein
MVKRLLFNGVFMQGAWIRVRMGDEAAVDILPRPAPACFSLCQNTCVRAKLTSNPIAHGMPEHCLFHGA